MLGVIGLEPSDQKAVLLPVPHTEYRQIPTWGGVAGVRGLSHIQKEPWAPG